MKTNMIVIDEFYNNPNDVREFALSQEFDVTGNWPGTRTKTFINESTKETIQKILQDVSGNVTDWQANDGYTGSFQLTTSMDRGWIHADSYNTWAGVLYLTPNAPASAGTGIFRHKKTGLVSWDLKNKTEEDENFARHNIITLCCALSCQKKRKKRKTLF